MGREEEEGYFRYGNSMCKGRGEREYVGVKEGRLGGLKFGVGGGRSVG